MHGVTLVSGPKDRTAARSSSLAAPPPLHLGSCGIRPELVVETVFCIECYLAVHIPQTNKAVYKVIEAPYYISNHRSEIMKNRASYLYLYGSIL